MKVGDIAPDFELESNIGEKIKLSSHVGLKKIILFFYPKDNSPGCTSEVRGIKDHYDKISKEYEVFGISQDDINSHVDFCQKNNLPFQLLSDHGKKVASLYDARGALGMYTKRVTFLIGLDGRIEKIAEGLGASKHVEFIQEL